MSCVQIQPQQQQASQSRSGVRSTGIEMVSALSFSKENCPTFRYEKQVRARTALRRQMRLCNPAPAGPCSSNLDRPLSGASPDEMLAWWSKGRKYLEEKKVELEKKQARENHQKKNELMLDFGFLQVRGSSIAKGGENAVNVGKVRGQGLSGYF